MTESCVRSRSCNLGDDEEKDVILLDFLAAAFVSSSSAIVRSRGRGRGDVFLMPHICTIYCIYMYI